jgi:hypothetical protein
VCGVPLDTHTRMRYSKAPLLMLADATEYNEHENC